MSKIDYQHYYTDDQKELTNRKEITFRFLSFDYRFETADNIFSKDQVDFGTRVLLEASLDSGFEGEVLDYGCGYGVVGIILSKNEYDVLGIDVTDRAIKLTKINNELNKTDMKVLKVSENLEVLNDRFNTVLLNPPIRAGKEVIYSMFKNSYDFLKKDGQLFIVIKKQHGAQSAIKYLETLFDEVEVIEKRKGYFIIRNTKH